MPETTDTEKSAAIVSDAQEYKWEVEEAADAIRDTVRDQAINLIGRAYAKRAGAANDNKKTIQRAMEAAGWKIAETVRSQAEELLKLAIIRAKASVRDGVVETNPDALNKRELGAIYSLICYAVYQQNLQPEQVEAMMEREFSVDHIALIDHRDYQRAVEYLLDFHAFTESRYGEGR